MGKGKKGVKYRYTNSLMGPSCTVSVCDELSFALRKGIEVRKTEVITNIQNCITAGLFRTVKDSIRHDKYGYIQKFNCKVQIYRWCESII